MSRLSARFNPEGLIASTLLAFLATAGMFYVNIMAALVDGLVTGLGFTNAQAGDVSSANVYGAAAGALTAVFAVKHIRWRPTALALLIALIAVDLASVVVRSAGMLTVIRGLHGALGGLLVGVAYSVMARLEKPDRAFGMLLIVQYGLGGLGVMWLPKLVPAYGAGVLFIALAAFGALALAMLAFIPAYPRPRVLAMSDASILEGSHPSTDVGGGFPLPRRYPIKIIVAVVGALFLFQAGNMGLGAYILGLARHSGLSADFASDALGYATWIGVLGAVGCVVLGTRLGRFMPLLVAMVVTLAGTYAFHFSDSASVYALANSATAVVWAFAVPYLFGMCAQMDRGGQLTVLGGFCSKMGLATGPFIAGRVLAHDNYALLINLTVGVLVLSALLALPTARLLDRPRAD